MAEAFELAREIMQLMGRHRADDLDGTVAMATALVVSLMDMGVTKAKALEVVSATWDRLEPEVRKKLGRHDA